MPSTDSFSKPTCASSADSSSSDGTRGVAGEVPCVHHGRDGGIERPAAQCTDGLRNVRELGKLRVLDRAVAVERAYRACLVVAVELRVERAQRFLRRVERGGGVSP